jgi:hypothetical protein
MALLDEVREFEQTVLARLTELEPLVQEYDQLRAVAEQLGLRYTPEQPGTVTSDSSRRGARPADTGSAGARSAAKARSARSAPAKKRPKRASRRPAVDAGTEPRAAAASASKDTPARAQPAPMRDGRGQKATGARSGQRSDDVLRLVGQQPGITTREVGARLGVDASGLYRVTRKLTADGRLRKDGPQLYRINSAASADPRARAAAPTPRDDDAGADTSAEPGNADVAAGSSARGSAPPRAAPRGQARPAAKGRSGRGGARVRDTGAAAGPSAKTAARPAKPPAGARRARTRRSTRRGRPADEVVMRIVAQQPGITVPGLSERLKVNRPDLYRVTTALAKTGRLRMDGPKLYLAEAPAAHQTEAPASKPTEPGAAAPPGSATESDGSESAADASE